MSIKLQSKGIKKKFHFNDNGPYELVTLIINELNGADIEPLKYDHGFLKFIGEIVECYYSEKPQKNKAKKFIQSMDKMQLFCDILKRFYPNINEDELSICKDIIEFLLIEGYIKGYKIPIRKFIYKGFINGYRLVKQYFI
jgi:hypothetical protein